MYQCIYNRLKTSYTIHVLFIINKTKMISIMLDNVALFRNKKFVHCMFCLNFLLRKVLVRTKIKYHIFIND
jgi:hypothetical protein